MASGEAGHRDAMGIESLAPRLEGLERRVEDLRIAVEEHGRKHRQDAVPVREALAMIYDDDRDILRRLRALRETTGYEAAFTDPAPLVSVVIPTYNRPQVLIERAIPSALAQSHSNIEVIVVGDAAAEETVSAVRSMAGPRVRFFNLSYRSPAPEDPTRAWFNRGTRPFNEGVAAARGQWIAPLGDDDAFTPGHVERLLERARESRAEFVYGQIRMTSSDGSVSLLGAFPPRLGQVNLQAAIYHAGLRFIELEQGHVWFDLPNDWGMVRRMLRVGVRMAMVEEVSVDYWPSERIDLLRDEPPVSLSRRLADAEDLLTEARASEAQLARAVSDGAAELERLGAETATLREQLAVVVGSRSWRLTRPLRRLRGRDR